MKIDPTNLIWIDLEMTGLDPDHDKIIEIGTVITDKNLNILASGPALAIHQSDRVLAKMDEWCTRQHGSSGLTERVRKSKISLKKAEQMTLDFIKQYVPEGASPMCGNTICQDRRFLFRGMPTLEKYFHYRNFDVSSFKILAKNRYPTIAKQFHKQTRHEALSDVYDSINEMKFYLENICIH